MLIRVLIFCCFYTSAQAQYTCREIFPEKSNTQTSVSTPRQTLSLGAKPSQKSTIRSSDTAETSTVYRDPQLLKDLIKNRKFAVLSSKNREGAAIRWFLSLSNNGRLYRVVIKLNSKGKMVDMYADKPFDKIEKTYYRTIGRNLELEGTKIYIKLPRKGKRELVINPSVIVKLEVKHDISVEQLIHALKRVPQNVQYRRNNMTKMQGKDSFLFFLDLGYRVPLEVVMLFENNTYTLLTAFFPDVYRP